jgi:hypothetical protein
MTQSMYMLIYFISKFILYEFFSCISKDVNYYSCPHVMDEENSYRCDWYFADGTNGYQQFRHCLWLKSPNRSYRTIISSYITPMDPEEFVQPAMVPNLFANSMTSRSANISWSSVNERQFIYRVNYSSQWDSSFLKTNSTSILLENLVPFTNYTLSVECIPFIRSSEKGYWSVPSIYTFQTKPDVPASAPGVTAGSFHIKQLSDGYKTLTVHWQLIPKRFSNGVIDNTSVCYSQGFESHLPMECEFVSGSITTADLTLRSDENYTIFVKSKNSVGYNDSLPLVPIFIPRQENVPPYTDNFVVFRNDSNFYHFSWSPVFEAVQYTIYWCRLRPGRWSSCMDSFSYKIIPAPASSFEMNLPSTEVVGMRFSISTEIEQSNGSILSSGMLYSNCTFNFEEIRNPPSGFTTVTHPDANSIHLEWQPLDCNQHAGIPYVSHYLIQYCEQDSCEDTVNTLNVSASNYKAVISNLQSDRMYLARIKSGSHLSESNYTAWISVYVFGSVYDFRTSYVIAGICGVSVLVAGIIFCLIRLFKKCRKEIPIEPPAYLTFTILYDFKKKGYYYQPKSPSLLSNDSDTSLIHSRSSSENADVNSDSQQNPDYSRVRTDFTRGII